MTKPTCVIVDAYSTGRYLPAAMAEYGFRSVHVRSSDAVSHYFAKAFPGEDFEADFAHRSIDETVSALTPFAPALVLAGSEPGVNLADHLAARFGCPGNRAATTDARRNKHAMAHALEAQGVRAIRHCLAQSAEDVHAFRAVHGLVELVLKPVDSATTEDVYFCVSDADIERACSAIIGKRNIVGRVNTHVLAQERIRGRQYTVNAVCLEGRPYVGEVWTYETVDVPGAGSICSHESLLDGADPIVRELGEYLARVLQAVELREGPAHAEIIVDEFGPVIVDLGARLQGFMSPCAHHAATGQNHITLTTMRYAAPERFRAYVTENEPYRRRGHALVVSLLSQESGRVTGLPGLDRIAALPTFVDAIGFVPEGSLIVPTRDLSSTPGLVYLMAADEAALMADYATIRAMSMRDIFGLVPDAEEGE